jgi:hypothetical protein
MKNFFTKLLLFCVLSWALSWSSAFSQSNTAFEEEIFSDENLLILDIKLRKKPLNTAFEAYQHEGGFFIPLGALSQAVQFAIEVDGDTGLASGWFINENNLFVLDLSRQELVIKGEKKSLNINKVYPYFGDIFVDTSLIEEWFGISVAVKMSQLTANLKPDMPLPVEKQLKRAQLKKELAAASKGTTVQESKLPKKHQKYKLFSLPFIDFSNSQTLSKSSGILNRNNQYSLLARSDIGLMNAQLNMTGSAKDKNKVGSVNTKLERKSYDGNVAPFFPANHVIVGDINAVSSPYLNSSPSGRGIYVSQRDLNSASQFDKTDFIGTSHPNWDIELYRNNVLIDILTVGNDQKYEFRDIPILFGENNFRLVFYGPQGEIEYKVHNYNIASSTLLAGEYEYEFSLDQRERSVVEVTPEPQGRPEDYRYIGSARVGLNNNFTLKSIFTHMPEVSIDQEFEQHKGNQYQTFILQGNLHKVYTESKYIRNMRHKGWLSEFSANTRLFDITTRATLTAFRGLTTPTLNSITEKKKHRIEYSFSGSALDFFLSKGIGYTIDNVYESFKDNSSTNNNGITLTSNFNGVRIAATMDHAASKSSSGATTRSVNGNITTTQRLRTLSISSTHDYQLQAKADILSSNFTIQKLYENDISVGLNFGRNYTGNMVTNYGASISKKFKKVLFSFNAGGDNEENYSFGTQFSFAFGYDPRGRAPVMQSASLATGGVVSARAFHDKNYNNQLDEGEETLSGVEYSIKGLMQEGKEGKPRLITNIAPYLPTDISLVPESLDDPFLFPADEGYNVTTHPGTINYLDFPVVSMTEADGTVRVQKGYNTKEVMFPEIIIKKQGDKDFLKEVRGEYDGFYIADRLKPGKYIIEIGAKTLKRYGINKSPTLEFEVEPGSDFMSGLDILLIEEEAKGTVEKAKKNNNPEPKKVSFDGEEETEATDEEEEENNIKKQNVNEEIKEKEVLNSPTQEYMNVPLLEIEESRETAPSVDITQKPIILPDSTLPPMAETTIAPQIPEPLAIKTQESTQHIREIKKKSSTHSIYKRNENYSPLSAIVQTIEENSAPPEIPPLPFEILHPEGVDQLIEKHKKQAQDIEQQYLQRKSKEVGPFYFIGPVPKAQENEAVPALPEIERFITQPPVKKKIKTIQEPALYNEPYKEETIPAEEKRPIEEKTLEFIGPKPQTNTVPEKETSTPIAPQPQVRPLIKDQQPIDLKEFLLAQARHAPANKGLLSTEPPPRPPTAHFECCDGYY